MEMARSLLKHMRMPNYLWGEAIRHATYLIKRIATRSLQDQTPYEALRGRKPNISHMCIFGGIGYAKIDKVHLRKLGDRSRTLVHLGTEPGSKDYKLFDADTRRIVVSLDVIFDETKGLNWKKHARKVKSYGDFVVTMGEFGNHGVTETSNLDNDNLTDKTTNNENENIDESENSGTNIFEPVEESQQENRVLEEVKDKPRELSTLKITS